MAVIGKIRTTIREMVDVIAPRGGIKGRKASVNWKVPVEGCIKMNCDGGFNKENGHAGIKVVVRNYEGSLLNGECDVVMADCLLVVEALAIRKDVKLVIEKRFQKVEIEMDSLIVHAEIVNKKKEMQWVIWPIIRDIDKLLNQSFFFIFCLYV